MTVAWPALRAVLLVLAMSLTAHGAKAQEGRCVEARGSAREPNVEARGSAREPTVEAREPNAAADPDCFVDVTGAARSPGRAYDLLHKSPETHHLIALSEDVLFLAIGTTWYWLARDKNLVDWDRPSAKARFTLDVIRLDNNDFPINFTLHPWSGAAYYTAARTNGISIAVSSLYSLGATLAWEYGIEFREKVSLNDLIFTPLTGITLGEFFSRLMLYVNRFPTRPTLAQRTFGVLFGPMQAFTDAVTGQNQVVGGPRDNLGLSANQPHRFYFHAGVAFQSAQQYERALATFGFDGSFVSVPSHLRPGRFHRFLHDGDFLRLWLSFAQGAGEREFDSYADMSLFGIYDQEISPDLRGGYVFLGSSLGYRYRRSLLLGFQDEVAATHLPGLALETALLFGRALTFQLSYRLQPDFAGVSAPAYPAWQAAHPGVDGKSVTAKHGYIYGFGVTSLLEASLSFPRVTFGGRTWFAAYNSTEGLDRTQETLEADPRGYERVLDAETYLRIAPFPSPGVTLELRLLSRRRSSRHGGYVAEEGLLRAGLSVGVLL
jgi:hypothetical protein